MCPRAVLICHFVVVQDRCEKRKKEVSSFEGCPWRQQRRGSELSAPSGSSTMAWLPLESPAKAEGQVAEAVAAPEDIEVAPTDSLREALAKLEQAKLQVQILDWANAPFCCTCPCESDISCQRCGHLTCLPHANTEYGYLLCIHCQTGDTGSDDEMRMAHLATWRRANSTCTLPRP